MSTETPKTAPDAADARMEAARTETLTTTEAGYLRERITCSYNTRRAAVASEQGNESLAWAATKAAQIARNGFGWYGRKLTKERKAELTKMAAAARF